MPDPEAEFAHWRETLLRFVLLTFLGLGALVSIPGIYVSLVARAWPIAAADLLALAWMATLLRWRTLRWGLRVWGFLLLPLGLGWLFLRDVGSHGLLFLLCAPPMAALLLGRRSALAAVVCGTAIILAVGPGLGPLSYKVAGDEPLLLSWTMLVMDFVFIACVIALATATLLRKLESSIRRTHDAQAELQRLAMYDSLTGLPNRRYLLESLERALAHARHQQHPGALLFIDLDHFKNVNDTRGHSAGDTHLKAVSERLAAQLGDGATLARLGGDEFVVLLPELKLAEEAASHSALLTAERLRAAMEAPIDHGLGPTQSTISIGVALFPRRDQSADDLLREADTAMYRAKEEGRNRIAFFKPAMQSELQERLVLESDLAQAVAHAQLGVAVQAQFDAQGRTVGAELLLRWQHPTRGAIPPAQFIPLAEHTGQIVAMGEWVLAQACQLTRRLRAQGLHFPVSVNISPRQFRQPDFVPRVQALLAQHGTQPGDLIFEVTEGLLIKDTDDTVARMHELVALGVRFSVDDFGTGYSSLSYLKRLPLYELKIDRAFVQDTPEDPNDTAIVRLVLSMARELGLSVVAEGVETHDQADFLIAHGCDRLQGYLYARPCPLDAFAPSTLCAALTA
jgi:diguanylate cyclase (GGDEF)-like protein